MNQKITLEISECLQQAQNQLMDVKNIADLIASFVPTPDENYEWHFYFSTFNEYGGPVVFDCKFTASNLEACKKMFEEETRFLNCDYLLNSTTFVTYCKQLTSQLVGNSSICSISGI